MSPNRTPDNGAVASHSLLFATLLIIAVLGLSAMHSEASTETSSFSPVRTWQGIPGIERTPQGRVFVSWFSGGAKEPEPENTVLISYSDDNGKTFNSPLTIGAPTADGTRCFDPTPWIDPKGRLWYIFNRGNQSTATHDVRARICERPDANPPIFGPEFKVGYEVPFAFRMNKITVLSTGEWLMPVTHAAEPVHAWCTGYNDRQQPTLHGVGISKDEGKTWKLHGAVRSAPWALENMITELKDGRLWMLIRTSSGHLWESFSLDRGLSWSEGKRSTIASPGSRFFIRRLASGNLLLVNHYNFKGRSHLTAQLSIDDGHSWNNGLLLDERDSVSYPDGVQDKDGLIWLVHDRDRGGAAEILMSTFREEDVLAGHAVSGKVRLKQMVSRIDRSQAPLAHEHLLPDFWDPKQKADAILAKLVKVTAPEVKGAHDAEMVLVGNKAYIVAEVNDLKAGEGGGWPFIYSALSIVSLDTLKTEQVIPVARGEQIFENGSLPDGACFVPRILQLNKNTLRCFFASEAPGKRQAKTWYRDFHLETLTFDQRIYPAKLKTSLGTFEMEPQHFHADAAKVGFGKPPKDYGLYIFDSFKVFGGKTYVALNNFIGAQNGLAVINEARDTFEVIGHYNEPSALRLSESSVNQLPDGTWLAICRQDGGNGNYTFTTSKDGVNWSIGEHLSFVSTGTNSKPTFDRFRNIYYLGWQDKAQINGVSRSVFNIDISVDGKRWERKYRFESEQSFQYPTFHEHRGNIWLCVTQGDSDPSRKERIMFGRLE